MPPSSSPTAILCALLAWCICSGQVPGVPPAQTSPPQRRAAAAIPEASPDLRVAVPWWSTGDPVLDDHMEELCYENDEPLTDVPVPSEQDAWRVWLDLPHRFRWLAVKMQQTGPPWTKSMCGREFQRFLSIWATHWRKVRTGEVPWFHTADAEALDLESLPNCAILNHFRTTHGWQVYIDNEFLRMACLVTQSGQAGVPAKAVSTEPSRAPERQAAPPNHAKAVGGEQHFPLAPKGTGLARLVVFPPKKPPPPFPPDSVTITGPAAVSQPTAAVPKPKKAPPPATTATATTATPAKAPGRKPPPPVFNNVRPAEHWRMALQVRLQSIQTCTDPEDALQQALADLGHMQHHVEHAMVRVCEMRLATNGLGQEGKTWGGGLRKPPPPRSPENLGTGQSSFLGGTLPFKQPPQPPPLMPPRATGGSGGTDSVALL